MRNFWTSWRIFDVLTNFLTCFWRHELFGVVMNFLTTWRICIAPWQTFWHHDEHFDVMTYFWRHIKKLFDVMKCCLRHDKRLDIMTCFWGYELFDVMTNILTSRHISDVMMNFLNSWWTFWIHDELFLMWWTFWHPCFGVMTNILTSCQTFLMSSQTFWRYDVFLMLWQTFDIMINFWRPDIFWCHDNVLMSGIIFDLVMCLWRHDELFDIMCFLCNDKLFWRHDELSDVMMNIWRHHVFLTSWHIFCIVWCHVFFWCYESNQS